MLLRILYEAVTIFCFLVLMFAIVFLSSIVAQAEFKPENLDCYKDCVAPIYCLDGQNYTRQDQIAKYGQAVGELCDYAMSTEQELFICEDNLELAYGPKLRRVRKRFKRKLRALKARCGK